MVTNEVDEEFEMEEAEMRGVPGREAFKELDAESLGVIGEDDWEGGCD